jgi:zinc transport system substrate-binding protein
MRLSRATAMTALATILMSVAGCGTDDISAAGTSGTTGTPKVIASTSWVGALAKAAGATDVTVIAPFTAQNPAGYEPGPADLAVVAGADYVLFAESDSFVAKITEAAFGGGKLVPVETAHTPAKITAEVNRLGALFGTPDAATAWLFTFDAEYAKLSNTIKAKLPTPAPTAVAHVSMASWGDFAGLQITGTYGPQPATTAQVQALAAKKPGFVLASVHAPSSNPAIPGADRVELANYPKDDLDLLGVFRANAAALTAATLTAATRA